MGMLCPDTKSDQRFSANRGKGSAFANRNFGEEAINSLANAKPLHNLQNQDWL
jgi:hypothetical protein